MSNDLHLIRLSPNLSRLLPWAQRRGLVPDRGQGDLGYAFHAALRAAFANRAPQPFSYRVGQGLLAYTIAMRDRVDRLAVLQQFVGPKLLLAGTVDGSVKIESSRAQQSAFTHYIELEGVGHLGMVEEKEKTLEVVQNFVREVLK